MNNDPMASFEVKNIIPLEVFGIDISITNSSLFMCLAVLIICITFWIGTSNKHLVPTKLQYIIEKIFFFTGNIVKTNINRNGILVFPYIISLFLFIMIGNIIGLFPYAFAFTSQLVVTLGMAVIVFISSIIIGIQHHGIGYFKRFCPAGVPGYLAPILIIIEIMSFLFRPVSLGVRLFANMMAGHIMIKVIAGFAVSLAGIALTAYISAIPVALNILLNIFKLVVCMLQAYVFAVLTCMYLAESLEDAAH
jgi:F-type H+-transporting ATPase subunit a